MTRVRYPRTPHHPSSPGAGGDDVQIASLGRLRASEIVITAKLDGESFTGYRDGWHPRSPEPGYHVTRTRAAALWARVAPVLPDPPFRVCCENLGGRHAIAYTELPSPLFVLNVWDTRDVALSWPDTITWARRLGLPTVPELYRGRYDESVLPELADRPTPWSSESEGWVMRTTGEIPREEWGLRVAKWVRADHVQDGAQHWRTRPDSPVNSFARDAIG